MLYLLILFNGHKLTWTNNKQLYFINIKWIHTVKNVLLIVNVNALTDIN